MTFEAILESFWRPRATPETLYQQPPLTDEMVERAESMLGVKLPVPYLTLLRRQNGGYTSDAFQAHPAPEPTSWAADHVPFDSMFGIGAKGEGVLQSAELLREWNMPDGL